jgi:two-component system response regulator YesN
MYRLMIVDDEPVLRNGLAELIQWSTYNIQVVGTSRDGIEALELLQETQPHIVITDVQMPRMNGVELSQKIREISADIQIIFISGFDELDYLRNALQVQAADYILKPLKHSDLEAVLVKVLQRLDETEEQQTSKQLMEQKLSKSLSLLQTKQMQDLIKNDGSEVVDWQEQLDLLDWHYPLEGLFLMFVVSVDNPADTLGLLAVSDQKLAAALMKQECERAVALYAASHCYFESGLGEYTCVMHFKESDQLETFLEQIHILKQHIKEISQLCVSMGVGETFGCMDLIRENYNVIVNALRQKLYYGKNSTIYAGTLHLTEKSLDEHTESEIEKIIFAIKQEGLASEQLNPTIEQLFQRLCLSKQLSLEDCRRICLRIILDASAPYALLYTEMIRRWEKSFWQKITSLDILEDMKETVYAYLSQLYTAILDGQNSRHHKTVVQLKRLIQQRYHRKLTIEDLAKETYLAPNYLSTLFKQETGVTINEYIMGVRVEKAKELILDTNKRIVDISLAVGYADPAFFTKVFKRYTGMSPSDFKNKIKP